MIERVTSRSCPCFSRFFFFSEHYKMDWARFRSKRLPRCCGSLRELLPRSDLPGAQQKTPFNVNRYVLLLIYAVGVACTGPLFINWSPLAELLFRNEAFAELCNKDPVTGAYTPDLRRRDRKDTAEGGGGGAGEGGGGRYSYICDLQEATVQQLYTLCCAVCCCFCAIAGSLMDILGPRVTMVAGRLLQTVGWLLLAFADVSSKLYYVGIAFFASGVDAVVLPTLSVCRLFPESEGLIITVVGSALSASYAVPLVMKCIAEAYGESFRIIVLRYALLCPFTFAIVAFFFVPQKNFKHFPADEGEAAAGVNDHAGGKRGGGMEKVEFNGVEAVTATDSGVTDDVEGGKEKVEELHRRQSIERRGGEEEEEEEGEKTNSKAVRDNNGRVKGGGEQQEEGRMKERGDKEEEEDDDDKEMKFNSRRKTVDPNEEPWMRGSSSVSTTRGAQGASHSYSDCYGNTVSSEGQCVGQDDSRRATRMERKIEENSGNCKSKFDNSSRTRHQRGSAKSSSRRSSNSSCGMSDTETRLQVRTCSAQEARDDKGSSTGVTIHRTRGKKEYDSQQLDAAASTVVVVEEAGSSDNMRCCNGSNAFTRDRCSTEACDSFPGRKEDAETGNISAAAAAAACAPACPANVSPALGTAVTGRTTSPAAAAASQPNMEEVAIPGASHNSSGTVTDASFLIDNAIKSSHLPSDIHLHHSAGPAPMLFENVQGGGAGFAAASDAGSLADSTSCFVASDDEDDAACAADARGGAGRAGDGASVIRAAPVADAANVERGEGGGPRKFRVEEVFAADAPFESEEDSKALLTTDSSDKRSSNNYNSSSTPNKAGEGTGVGQGSLRESIPQSAAPNQTLEMISISGETPAARTNCGSTTLDTADITCNAANDDFRSTDIVIDAGKKSVSYNDGEVRGSRAGALHQWTSMARSSITAGSRSTGGEEAAARTGTDTTSTRLPEESTIFDTSPQAGESFSTASDATSPPARPPPAALAAGRAEGKTSAAVAADESQAVLSQTQLGSRSKRSTPGGLLWRLSVNSSSLLHRLGVDPQRGTAAGGGPSTVGTGAADTLPTSFGGSNKISPTAIAPTCTSGYASGEGNTNEGRYGSCDRSSNCSSSSTLLELQKKGWRAWWMRWSQSAACKSAVRQFLSERYLLIILYKIVVVVAATYFQEASQRMFSSRVLHVRALLLPFSFLPCIALGKSADRFGIVCVLFVVNFFGFATYFFSFFSQYSVAWAYVSSCFFVCYMSFYSSQIFIYIETTFSPEHFGKLSGFSLMIGGVTSLATHPLYSQLTVVHHAGNTLPVRIALTVPLLLLNLLIVRLLLLYRKNPRPFRNAVSNDEELGGHTRGPAAAILQHPQSSGEKGYRCRGSSSSKLHEFPTTGATAVPNNDEFPVAASLNKDESPAAAPVVLC